MRDRLVAFIAAALLAALAAASTADAQSRCADCHFANMQPAFAAHVSDWDLSAHGRAGVGCDGCHGGNPSTFEQFAAHRGVEPPGSPSSAVHRSRVVTTCGKCHAGPFVAFQKSRHFSLLSSGNPAVPTCTTCHDAVGSRLLSPKGLEGQCATCHGANRPAGHAEFPARGRAMLQGVRDARERLKQASALIARVSDRQRRSAFEAAARQAQVPLTQATDAGHAFVYTDLEERLATANSRITALFEQLANPSPRR